MMRLQVAVAGADEDEPGSRSLCRWLQETAAVTRVATVQMIPDPEAPTGSMGGLELIDLMLRDAGAMGTVLLGYLNWRLARRGQDRSEITIIRGDQRIVVKDVSPDLIAEIVRDLEAGDGS